MSSKAEQARNRRNKRRLNGLCSVCGKRPPQSGVKCVQCNSKQSLYYHKRISRGICPCGKKLNGKKRCDECVIVDRDFYYSLVRRVIEHYGGKCSCCGNGLLSCLTIDHINGGGRQHEREIGKGAALYRWLENSAYPDGFQVLCANCNYGRARNGGICPHAGTHCSKPNQPHTRSRQKAKLEAIAAYGGKCVVCGETEPVFLVLDHVDGGGKSHRKQVKSLMVIWARQNNYPDILQLLCDNCNTNKERPHFGATTRATNHS